MLTLSAKCVYGLTALIELAQKYNTGPTQIRDIAGRHEIPQHYLEQLLGTLRKAGIVESFRGAQGGYALARPPANIAVSEILESLDGPLEIVSEKHRNGYLKFFWDELEPGVKNLVSMSLEDLSRSKQQQSGQYMYNI